MSARPLPVNAGLTLLEMAIASAILSLAVVTVSGLTTTTGALASDTRANARATHELRRNLEALANAIRGADLATLTGFDVNWQSSNPTFARVVGADLSDRIYGPTEEIRWAASSTAVDGVESPGAVYLVVAGSQRLMADRVPQGGFQVRLDGSTLVVTLTTYYTTRDGTTVMAEGSTAVTLRN